MSHGVDPLSWHWGLDRGLPFHRYYLEMFLTEQRADIRGAILEFQDPQYASQFGGDQVRSIDILHVDDSNPAATLVGDLTRPNNLPSDRFDCIICTHVLHMIGDLKPAISELHRMLRPGGVLLVAVPGVSMDGIDASELWRFTTAGLRWLLEPVFRAGNVDVRGYGNSLTAAAFASGRTMPAATSAPVRFVSPPVSRCSER